MARRQADGPQGCGMLLGVLLLIGLAILIIKWALITAAILAVPFGLWWIYDQVQQRKVSTQQTAASSRRAEVEGRDGHSPPVAGAMTLTRTEFPGGRVLSRSREWFV